MPILITMPSLSPTMTAGNISAWKKNKGDNLKPGDIICEVETDKAVMDVETVEEGILEEILIPSGTQDIKVNTPIAIIRQEGDADADIESFKLEQSMKPIESSKDNTQTLSNEDNVKINSNNHKKSTINPLNKSDLSEHEFDINAPTISITVREALRDAMKEEMHRDKDVFIIGEEVAEYQGAYKVTQGLLQEFSADRVIDTPITEHGFTGVGIGASFTGLKPIVEFMTFNFAMQAIDQIINSAAKTRYMSGGQIKTSIVFRGPNGSASRVAAQHSQCYAAWYSHIPGLKVIMPYTASDAKGLLKAAIRDPNPVVFLENEVLYGKKFEVPVVEDLVIPIGKARIHRTGNDITLVSFGIGMTYAIKAISELENSGIDVELIDLRTIRPMDLKTIFESVKKTGRLVTVEEGYPQSSVGSEIANRVQKEIFDYLDAPIITVTGKDVPMPYAVNLEKLALPNVNEIIEAIESVCYKRKART
ncbi:pyruvate dehydrogenase complex E1 component subunit beta [Candidatus Liberibacter americanus]|uniref:Pyruvate dehydrogenase E1 component subunit beta n=1 Tax=Candidatus Liberibacter americanus str. Sao Paulo TaxID=1261131 RepID=U6B3S6_9HYPH|nr:pyruvate dehydrogenase complex E1 component subunit beta [Candidatus Liberibacter americanus]AHA27689.1 Thiamine pyrophosphate-dependent dehydrogenase, E1 component beta subunit [Candidatus Liberibacter americanus str. Sao Paulo]EMS36396.1 pyruvate dehydrogenase subunit beta [Candidatus Liberibacter americanus PW_SP]